MTATNHAVTGAVVAVIFQQPLLAIPIAFAMHFVMDAIPHFSVQYTDVFSRNKNQLFKQVLVADVVISASLLIVLPFILSPAHSPYLVFASMLACMSPDLVWGWRFLSEIRTKTEKPKGHFSRFHLWVQHSETIRGAYAEAIWFFVASVSLIYLA